MKRPTITIRAKDYWCICGRRADVLNLSFDDKYGNALCNKCRDKELLKSKEVKSK